MPEDGDGSRGENVDDDDSVGDDDDDDDDDDGGDGDGADSADDATIMLMMTPMTMMASERPDDRNERAIADGCYILGTDCLWGRFDPE